MSENSPGESEEDEGGHQSSDDSGLGSFDLESRSHSGDVDSILRSNSAELLESPLLLGLDPDDNAASESVARLPTELTLPTQLDDEDVRDALEAIIGDDDRKPSPVETGHHAGGPALGHPHSSDGLLNVEREVQTLGALVREQTFANMPPQAKELPLLQPRPTTNTPGSESALVQKKPPDKPAGKRRGIGVYLCGICGKVKTDPNDHPGGICPKTVSFHKGTVTEATTESGRCDPDKKIAPREGEGVISVSEGAGVPPSTDDSAPDTHESEVQGFVERELLVSDDVWARLTNPPSPSASQQATALGSVALAYETTGNLPGPAPSPSLVQLAGGQDTQQVIEDAATGGDGAFGAAISAGLDHLSGIHGDQREASEQQASARNEQRIERSGSIHSDFAIESDDNIEVVEV